MQHILDVQFPEENPTGAPGGDFQRIQTSPAMFGGLKAQAEQTLGQGLDRSGNAAIDLATWNAQLDANAHADELHSWQSDKVTDAQSKFLQLKGRAALDALPAFKQEIDQYHQQARAQAGNPYTARLVDTMGRRLTDLAYSQASRYAAGQRAEWDTNTAVDGASSAGSRAALAAAMVPPYAEIGNDPNVGASLDRSDALARQAAGLKGLDGDIEAERNRGRNVAQIIKSVTADGSQTSLQRAINFFHSQYDQMDPASRATIEQSLKVASATYDGQKTADAYMGRGAYLPPGYYNTTVAIESGGNPNAQNGSHAGLVAGSPQWNARYGINDANRNDPTALARALSMENAENHDALARALGHEPTPADYYLAHQQGIGGAVAHLSQPNLPAWQNMASTVEGREKGAGWAKQAIWGNMTPEMRAQFPGGVDTVTSGDFVRMWSQRFYGQPIQAQGAVAQGSPPNASAPEMPNGVQVAFTPFDRLTAAQTYSQQSKADVLSKITNDPYLLDHPAAMSAAITYTNKIFEIQSANYADTERQLRIQLEQKKLVSDQTEADYLKQIYTPAPNAKPLSVATIVNDPALSDSSKERLVKLLGNPGDHDEKTYGKGFVQAFEAIHAAPGTPGRITDPQALYARLGPNGDLTMAGVEKLRGEIELKRTAEGQAEATMKKQFLANAKAQITGTDAGLGIKDPKGDELYLKFLAQALPAYDAGRRAGKSPEQLLNPDSPDYIGKGLIDQPGKGFRRPTAQWFHDVVAGEPGASVGTQPTFDIKTVKSLPELVAAFHAGHVTREQARAMALQNGWAAERPKTPISQ